MSMSTFGFATPPLRAENSAQSRRSASGGRAPCPQGEGHITAVPSAASRPPAQLATSYQFWRDITDKRDVKVTKFDRKSKSTPELMGMKRSQTRSICRRADSCNTRPLRSTESAIRAPARLSVQHPPKAERARQVRR